jgi:signal transduction histidine kinase
MHGAKALAPDAKASSAPDAKASHRSDVQASQQTPALSPRELMEFHEELRQRSLPILFWSACVFNTVYVAWCGFDYLLEPRHFDYFLVLRLAAATINTVLVVAVHQRKLQRFTWEAFWLWLFTKGLFIALMLRVIDASSYMAYVVGFTLVIYAAGLLPYWSPRWAVNIVGVLIVLSLLRFSRPEASLIQREAIASAFVLLSAAGLSLIMASFKYSLARRDFLTRRALSGLARREHDARVDLDRASGALRAALDQLKELDRLKGQFFANISHELRTPLTLILTPLEDMRPGLDRPRQHTLDIVRRNAERLLRLIDDLLELSRLDAGGLRLSLSEIDLRALSSGVYESALASARARGIRFDLRADAGVQRVSGDAHRLEIVLTNLVSNALKFTPNDGSVLISIQHLPDGAQIDVSDTGPGIAEEDLPHVFERFFQVLRTDRRRAAGGVGIGLALAKELVELHGGRLWVSSTLQEGSVFSVFLPYGRDHIRPEVIERRQRERNSDGAAALEQWGAGTGSLPLPADVGSAVRALPEAPIVMRGQRRPRIVLAEDQDELREFIAELLKPHCDVTCAADGARALALVQERRPDLVISDIMMPELSGAQVCARIKGDARLANTPVILLTARTGAEATLEGYAQGADDFVAKPFHPRVLLARVRAQLLLRKMALDLAEREKLAAVGTLAAGILHEVRNPVNAILNAARVLAEGPVDADMARRLLSVVGDCAARIHQLTESLDQHARPADAGSAAPSDVAKGMDATLALLGHRLRHVEVRREYGRRNVTRAPAGPINQIFLNLLDNALNAGARTLAIRIAEDPSARQLRVSIEDDGRGVPSELKERIFDAFVSGGANGSGLGLYLSRCIAEQHGGALSLCELPRARGALFTVSLPVAEGS